MFKNFHLDILNFNFFYFVYFVQKNFNFILTDFKIITLIQPKIKMCTFRVKGKINIFLYEISKVRKN